MPIVIGRARTAGEFSVFVTMMAMRNPRGFRSASTKNPFALTLVEKCAIAAGDMSPPKREYSKRG